MEISRQKIEALIAESGLKKSVIAHRMGMSAPTLISRLKEPERFTVCELARLASILRIPMTELFDFTCTPPFV